jgi:serine phosphatase RsbU (regulator of sigma subunit)
LWLVRIVEASISRGHPPLIRSSGSTLERISNSIVFQVMQIDYPLRIPISGGPLLHHTDGVIEPECQRRVLAITSLKRSFANISQAPPELLDQLLAAIRHWRPTSMAQQDDITIIAIDVV